jgi:hypothetical protein
MNLLEARDKVAAMLAPVDDDDPTVLVSLVDSVEPPALMLGWGEPWLTPTTKCFQEGRLTVTCIAGRLVPGEGVAKLEQLVAYVLERVSLPLVDVGGPRVFVIGNVNYLAARVTVKVPIEGGA